ncbi:hypothetical protein H9P43_002154 [Blastocladiella emersonii ATCC 22665]|nr:hypothetical protein H9P43_002154 [Blastocladiella emersonii ATCC 22665]
MNSRAALLALVALVAVLASAVSAASPASLAKRQLIPDTCTDALAFTAPKSGETWATGSKVTASWGKPPGEGFDNLSVQLMQVNKSDPMSSNRIMNKSLFTLAASLDPKATSATETLSQEVQPGSDFYVRVMWMKKGESAPIYSCSPFFSVVKGKDTSAAPAAMGGIASAVAVAVAAAAANLL